MDFPKTSGVSRADALAGEGGGAGSQTAAAAGLSRRLRACLVSLGCWAALGVAAWLTPHASGTGTHEELGMPACGFLVRTGLPCPTCGLTTSVSAMAHGRIVLACKAHPFGVVLFVALVMLAAAATIDAVAGRDLLRRLRPMWLAWVTLIGIPAGWAVKLIVGLACGTLPLR